MDTKTHEQFGREGHITDKGSVDISETLGTQCETTEETRTISELLNTPMPSVTEKERKAAITSVFTEAFKRDPKEAFQQLEELVHDSIENDRRASIPLMYADATGHDIALSRVRENYPDNLGEISLETTFRSELYPACFEAITAETDVAISDVTRLIHTLQEQLHNGIYVYYHVDPSITGGDSFDSLSREHERVFSAAIDALTRICTQKELSAEDVTHILQRIYHFSSHEEDTYAMHQILMPRIQALFETHTEQFATALLADVRNAAHPFIADQASYYLNRLELGKIAISDTVVKYFDINYTIKDGQAFSQARRVTSDGKIGLFDAHGALAGYFELGDLADPTLQRQVETLAITKELLFTDPNTPDNIRAQFLADYRDFFERIFQEVPGMRLSDLSLKEQMAVYQIWSTHTELWPVVEQLKTIAGIEGVKVVLVAENAANRLETLQALIERLPKKGAQTLLKECATTVQFAADVAYAFEGNETVDTQILWQEAAAGVGSALTLLQEYMDTSDDKCTLAGYNTFRSNKGYTNSRQAQLQGVIQRATVSLVNHHGDAATRQYIDAAIVQKKAPYVEKAVNAALESAYRFMTPLEDAQAIRDLEAFYSQDIQFETYEVNKQMNEAELARLQKEINEGDTVLDLGAGTGRLAVPLSEAGVKIDALDYSTRHVQLLQEQAPNMKSMQGDWKDTTLPSASYKRIYSLGRNILHETSYAGQLALFQEAHRLLQNGGTFMIDIPDRTQGSYKHMADKYAEKMKEVGIENTRYGTIYDSPDGKHFATRYAYAIEDIKQLAEAAGFDIIAIDKQTLATGHGDTNIYITLQKPDQQEQLAEAA